MEQESGKGEYPEAKEETPGESVAEKVTDTAAAGNARFRYQDVHSNVKFLEEILRQRLICNAEKSYYLEVLIFRL